MAGVVARELGTESILGQMVAILEPLEELGELLFGEVAGFDFLGAEGENTGVI